MGDGPTRRELPPGPPWPKPIQSANWIRRPMPFMDACEARHGDTFTIDILQEGPWVLLTHPGDVKTVFTGGSNLMHAGEANHVVEPLVGSRSILLLDEDPHMRERKLMLPSFHGERMKAYEQVMRDAAERELDRWDIGRTVPAHPHTQAIALEVILRAVFGLERGSRLDELRTALVELLSWTSSRARLALFAVFGPRVTRTPLLGYRATFERVSALIDAEVRRRRNDPALADQEDILSLLLQARYEDGSEMGAEAVRSELLTLLLAGHETTATALAWTLERLARHPEAAERAAADPDYLDAAIKETLRLRPILPIVIRRVTEPVELRWGTVPAGTKLAPCIYRMHRRAEVYPDPDRFRPERFLESPPGTYTWIPFGGGVRRCLGASFALFEMRVVLEALLARARPVATRDAAEPVSRRAITLAPARGAEVVLEAR